MTKKLGLILASVAAVAIVAVGSMTYACGGACKSGTKTAAVQTAGGSCASTGVKTAGSGSGCSSPGASGSSCASTGVKTAGSGSGCSSTGASGGSCSSKGAKNASAGGACGSGEKTKQTKMAGAACCPGGAGSAGCSSKMASLCGDKGYFAANVYDCKDGHVMAVYKGKKFEVTDKTPYTQIENARYYFADNECAVKCQETLKTMAAEINREAVSLATAEGNIVENKDGHKIAACKMSGEKFEVTGTTPARVMDGQKVYFCSENCASMASISTADKQVDAN
ncbi:hypothetical protein HZB60_04410 [candidate division KSB1 bacterium]|nr:hypothetical protein [candidate division KSB1 bacterium]